MKLSLLGRICWWRIFFNLLLYKFFHCVVFVVHIVLNCFGHFQTQTFILEPRSMLRVMYGKVDDNSIRHDRLFKVDVANFLSLSSCYWVCMSFVPPIFKGDTAKKNFTHILKVIDYTFKAFWFVKLSFIIFIIFSNTWISSHPLQLWFSFKGSKI